MAEFSIPFNHGQHEEADPKFLPNGLFTVAQNVRFQKDARVRIRNGFVKDATGNAPSLTPNVIASYPFRDRHIVHIVPRQNSVLPPNFVRYAFGAYDSPNTFAAPPGFEIARLTRQRTETNARNSTNSADVTLTRGISMASSDLDIRTNTLSVPELTVAGRAYVAGSATQIGGATVWVVPASTCAGAQTAPGTFDADACNFKVITISGVACVFWAHPAANTVRMMRMDTQAIATVVTSSAGRSQYFDVSAGGASTEAYLVHQNGAATLQFGTVSVAGAFVALNTIAVANEARPSITPTFNAPTDDIAIVWNEGATFTTGNCRFAVYRRSTTSFTTAATTMDTSGLCSGYPVAGQHVGQNWCGLTYRADPGAPGGSSDFAVFFTASTTPGSPLTMPGMAPASKPWIMGLATYAVCVNRNSASDSSTATYAVMMVPQNFAEQFGRPVAFFAQDIARAADMGALHADPRRKVVAAPALGADLGSTAAVGVFPLARLNDGAYAWYRFEISDRPTFQGALINGVTAIAAGRLCEYDGLFLTPNSFPLAPKIVRVVQTAGLGSIAVGTYQYVAVMEMVDVFGRRRQSAPSLPFSVTVAGANSLVQVYAQVETGWAGFITDSLRFYRTQAGATVFQECANNTALTLGYNPQAAAASIGLVEYDDITADAGIAANPVLYTQGERGGLSGLLPSDGPPFCTMIWAGSDRAIIAGLEDPARYQLSKLLFQGEGLQWSNEPQFGGTVGTDITAVAEMDGTWFLFTRENVWTVTGQGPDDNGAGGTFDSPRRLPSDIGCISAKSLVLTGQGLFFQGATDRLYLLPRGGGAPQWVGQPIRDTLLAFPYISASAFDEDSGLVYWAVCDTAAAFGRLLVFDTRISEWSVDNVQNRAIKTLAVYNGLLVIDGSILESTTSWQDSNGSSTANVIPTLTTGDIRAFGPNGWGRYKKVQIEGEARDVLVAWSLTLDVSYDSGKTFGETATWTRANLAAAFGDAIDGAEHRFITQKTDSIRLRLSMTTPSPTEGLVFNGLSLSIDGAPGLKRQANAYMAP